MATGRVKSTEITAGQGEPYFAKRDNLGRVSRVIYPDAKSTSAEKFKPQMEMRYEYGPDGRVARISTVDQTSSDVSTYGPEKYVVEYQHDGMGRVARKIVRANTAEDTSVHYEAGYQFDGRGRLVNERILRWDDTAKKMRTTQEIRTTYDLGGNPTTIETFNDYGLVVKEDRTYARGHQIKSFTLTGGPHSTITGATSGNCTYDTNNNLTGTPGTFTITQDQDGATRTMSYRQQWTFTFDRKNRMISFAKGSAPTERTNLWYDALGRVFQRWNDNPQTTDWAATATRYVFDGSRLVQEHEFDVEQINPEFKEGGGEGGEAMEEQPYWEYTYNKVLVDYLHQPGGLRQYRWDDDDEEYKTEFLMNDAGMPGARIERGTSITSVPKAQRTASGDRQADAEVTEFNHLSNLTISGGFVEGYGSESGATEGFDALQQVGGSHFLAGLGKFTSGIGDSSFEHQGKVAPPGVPVGGGSQYGCNCQDCRKFLEGICILVDPKTGKEHYDRFCCGEHYLALCAIVNIQDPCVGMNYSCGDLICGVTSNPPGKNKCICDKIILLGKSLDEAWQMCDWCQSTPVALRDCCTYTRDLVRLGQGCPKVTEYDCPANKYPTPCLGVCYRADREYRCNAPPCKGADASIALDAVEGPCTEVDPNLTCFKGLPYTPRGSMCVWSPGCKIVLGQVQYGSCRTYCAQRGVVYP